MQLTVKVAFDVARALHRQIPQTAESTELLKVVEALGVTLQAMHPDAADPDLMSYFAVEVPEAETAQRVVSRLRQVKAIEAAYLKPPDALP